MRFSVAFVAVLAQLTSATFVHKPQPPPDCGTVTVTENCKSATKTSYSHFPTVTETITKRKNVCETKVVVTKTDVHTSITKVYVTPTVTTLKTAHKIETVIKSKAVGTTTSCPPGGARPTPYKRHFVEERFADESGEVEEDEDEDDEFAGLTNGERLRRGLPLAKPVDKRTFCFGPHCHNNKPIKAGPSCVPKTVKVETTKTITKSVTPTKYVTKTKCGHTNTFASTVYVTSNTVETKTKTKPATTVCSTVTPTSTKIVHYPATVCVR